MRRGTLAPPTRTSNTHVTIDTDPHRQFDEAEQRWGTARVERRALEESRWSPRRRSRLDVAARQEREAARQLARARRLATERQHGAKPFMTAAELARPREQQVDRIVERGRRGSGRGREL